MKRQGSRAKPGNKEGPPSFVGTAAPRHGEQDTLQAFSYGNTATHSVQTEADAGLPQYPADGVPAARECNDPKRHPPRVTVDFVGAPDDDGRRARLVYDLLWGRWSQPPDTGNGAGVPAPKGPRDLTGGAAAEVETPATTTA